MRKTHSFAACMVLAIYTLACCWALSLSAQEPIIELVQPQAVVAEARTPFHAALLTAARNRVTSGVMSRRDFVRLRMALLSPAFAELAEDLACIQIAASGADSTPVDADGKFDRAKVTWDAELPYLDKLTPLVVQLISIFTGAE